MVPYISSYVENKVGLFVTHFALYTFNYLNASFCALNAVPLSWLFTIKYY